jgi:prolyl oligopeptidase family protein
LIRIFDTKGRLRREIPVPMGGSIWGGFTGKQRDPEVFYRYLGLFDPSTTYRLHVASGRQELVQKVPIKFDRSRFTVIQVFYSSDEDLDQMTREELILEVKRLRQGIREHRDSTRHEFCWHHPSL